MQHHEPDVGWQLLRALLPKGYDVGHNNPRPNWREWAPDPQRQVTRGEVIQHANGIVRQMIANAGTSGTRWEALIDALGALPVEQHETVIAKLAELDADQLESSDRAAIWNALREKISRHRSFPDADWARRRSTSTTSKLCCRGSSRRTL
jgi:hypothetical protein